MVMPDMPPKKTSCSVPRTLEVATGVWILNTDLTVLSFGTFAFTPPYFRAIFVSDASLETALREIFIMVSGRTVSVAPSMDISAVDRAPVLTLVPSRSVIPRVSGRHCRSALKATVPLTEATLISACAAATNASAMHTAIHDINDDFLMA